MPKHRICYKHTSLPSKGDKVLAGILGVLALIVLTGLMVLADERNLELILK